MMDFLDTMRLWPESGERVVVAMSGGVDSSLAAALLVEEGYDVVGVSMRLWEGESQSGCCTLDDFLDARRVAECLGIPFYVMDFAREFRRAVVDDFVAEYRRGRTPNPCARCNQQVKFGPFRERARELGARWIATGHYARRREAPGGGADLLRGVDAGKDQSYFLFAMGRSTLARTLFPIGELRKREVRAEAERRGLPVAAKPDSQEVCFAPPGRYAQFVERYAGLSPSAGEIVDRDGRVLGRHAGIHRFTIGQRRGLGLGEGGPPRYVTAIEPRTGRVRVGGPHEVESAGVVAGAASWLSDVPAPGRRVQVKIRSRFAPVDGWVVASDERRFTVQTGLPLRAVTPGQAAVLYDGERVLGGGWIERGLPCEKLPEGAGVSAGGWS